MDVVGLFREVYRLIGFSVFVGAKTEDYSLWGELKMDHVFLKYLLGDAVAFVAFS